MSLEGYVADSHGSADPLYPDMAALRGTVVGGASVVRQLLEAGLVDKLRVDVMPVVLGGDLRFLEHVDPARLRLERVAVQEVGSRTSLWFRVLKGDDARP